VQITLLTIAAEQMNGKRENGLQIMLAVFAVEGK